MWFPPVDFPLDGVSETAVLLIMCLFQRLAIDKKHCAFKSVL
jgi:hypothetical protein